jgi:RNA recognition motif-containing protein
MSKELYIGGLPYSVSDGQLKEIFSSHGTVESTRVIKGRFTRQSRGYGFVVMSAPAEADKAVEALNGTQLDGRTIVVRDAQPQMIRKILCPVGVAYAISLAQQNHAELVFLHVAAIPAGEFHQMAVLFQENFKSNQAPGSLVDKLFAQMKSRLNNFIGHNFDGQLSQLRWRVEVSLGKVASEVVQIAASQDFDLIVVTKKHRGFVSRLLSFSISESLIRIAHCPVVCISDASKASPWRGRPLQVLESAHQYS